MRRRQGSFEGQLLLQNSSIRKSSRNRPLKTGWIPKPEMNTMDTKFSVFNPRSISQGGRRGFEPVSRSILSKSQRHSRSRPAPKMRTKTASPLIPACPPPSFRLATEARV